MLYGNSTVCETALRVPGCVRASDSFVCDWHWKEQQVPKQVRSTHISM